MAELLQQVITAFLGISEALVSRCRSQAHEDGRTSLNPTQGRPPLLPPDHEQQIVEWLRLQTSAQHWPTTRELKEQITAHLEQVDSHSMPSTSYYHAIIPHLLGTEFNVRRAQPLEEDRFEVREENIHEHFRNLNELGISVTSLDP
jgi:hypothetical protein